MEVTDNGARQEVKFLPDTGAEIDAIPLSTYTARLADVELQKAVTPKTATGVPIHTEGKFAARLSWQRRDGSMRSAATEVHVLHNLAQPVLSKRTQIRLGMLDEGYPHTALNRVQYAEEPFPNTVATATEDQSAVAPLTAGPSNTVKDRTLKKLMADFPKTFDGKCRPIKGPPCHFRLVKGATPVAIRGSRPVADPYSRALRKRSTRWRSKESSGS